MAKSRSDLRARHTDLTRETILQALVEVITEGGLADFSIQQVADRAGVSHRTVYRHYPSRDALLEGLMEWVEDQMVELGGRFTVDDAADLAEAARGNLAVFDALSEGVEAMTRFSLGTGLEAGRRTERTELFTRVVEAELEGVDPAVVQAVAGLIRLLISSRAWLVLRQDGVTPPEHVAPVLSWALETLLEAVRSGRGPTLDDAG